MGVVGLVCLLLAAGMGLWGFVYRKRNVLCLKPGVENPQVAVLVPARDESAVIDDVLASLAKQTYVLEMGDVYVIVEDEQDPTVEICAKYGARVILRQELEKQRKGYALDEAVRDILKTRRYDVYFIFDADNVMEGDFVERMLRRYQEGYQIATGYREMKNQDPGIIEVGSGLTFAMINGIGNRKRLKNGRNMIFSGTGLYVDGRLIDEWQGWPFHSLTEDYEISLYAALNGIATCYEESAVFYDEQPKQYDQTVAQRTRWMRGYFDVRKEYIPQMRKVKADNCNNYGSLVSARIGVKPVVLMIVGVILVTIDAMVWLAMDGNMWGMLWVLVGFLGFVYIALMILTIAMIRREKLELSKGVRIKAVLFNPIYLVTYVPCAVRALLKPDVVWTKIRHGE